MTEIISLNITGELKNNIDYFRGDIPRSKFIARSVEYYIKTIRKDHIKKEKNLGGNSGHTEPTKYTNGGF
jgi:hypothetical protein